MLQDDVVLLNQLREKHARKVGGATANLVDDTVPHRGLQDSSYKCIGARRWRSACALCFQALGALRLSTATTRALLVQLTVPCVLR